MLIQWYFCIIFTFNFHLCNNCGCKFLKINSNKKINIFYYMKRQSNYNVWMIKKKLMIKATKYDEYTVPLII